MKKYTLLAFIGASMFILCNILNLAISLFGFDYETVSAFYPISGILSFTGWILIGLFFFKLYKNQK
jgi:hypothetical protein